MKLFTPSHGCASTYILHVHQVHVMHGKINWNWNHGKITWNHGKIDEHHETSIFQQWVSQWTPGQIDSSHSKSIEIQSLQGPVTTDLDRFGAFGNQETRGSCWLQCRLLGGFWWSHCGRYCDISDTYSDTLTFFVDMLFGILLVSDIYSDILHSIWHIKWPIVWHSFRVRRTPESWQARQTVECRLHSNLETLTWQGGRKVNPSMSFVGFAWLWGFQFQAKAIIVICFESPCWATANTSMYSFHLRFEVKMSWSENPPRKQTVQVRVWTCFWATHRGSSPEMKM